MAKDYYKILGVEKNADKDQIKRAYKKMAKKFHPDMNKDENASEKFKEINEAASVLGDDQKRQQYDQFGDPDSFKAASGYSGFDSSDFTNFASAFDFEDLFDRIFGGSSNYGFTRSQRRRARRGNDLLFELAITLEDAAKGIKKDIKVPRLEKCSDCDGSGAESRSDIISCPSCHGSGYEKKIARTPFGLFQTTTTCSKCRGTGEFIKKECHTCDGTGLVKNGYALQEKARQERKVQNLEICIFKFMLFLTKSLSALKMIYH